MSFMIIHRIFNGKLQIKSILNESIVMGINLSENDIKSGYSIMKNLSALDLVNIRRMNSNEKIQSISSMLPSPIISKPSIPEWMIDKISKSDKKKQGAKATNCLLVQSP